MAPAIAARRHAFRLLRDKEAVSILFDDIAPRFLERPGGYTRILRLATPRLGDAGTRAILEFVGVNDRVKRQQAERPAFDDEADVDEENLQNEDQVLDETAEDQAAKDEAPENQAAEDEGTDTAVEDTVDEEGKSAGEDKS